jgi:two-component system NtrC family sensor kinase
MSADPHQLQQVFLNMVNNAVDAILESSDQGDLWVATRSDTHTVCIEFTDSGPGVQEASRVFDPFYTTKPVGKGTGLGLSICYGIVTEHGGTIRVRNMSHRGASFTIELPLALTSTSQDEDLRTNRPERRNFILCISADDAVLKSLETIVSGPAHQVYAAKSIEEVRDVIDKCEFDVVVADLDNGDAAAAEGFPGWLNKYSPALSQRTIRLYTPGLNNTAPAESGVPDLVFLKKPLDAPELLDAVNKILSATVHSTTVVR